MGWCTAPCCPTSIKSAIGLELDKSVKALLIMYLQLFTSTPLHFNTNIVLFTLFSHFFQSFNLTNGDF